MVSFEERIERAVLLVREARAISAFTGAGISTESGISDFRSPGGVWDRYRIVTYQAFISSHEARVEYWKMKKELFEEMRDAHPNAAHVALAELERKGKLKCLITQNIDGLHQDAGSKNVIEIHGTNRKAVCLACGRIWPIEVVQERLMSGEHAPTCDSCKGYIKPATISFGQGMPEDKMAQAWQCATTCDLLLMIGSSLQVEPAASIPREARSSGARLIFINRTETPWDPIADIIFHESAGHVLSQITAGVSPWA